MQTLDLGVILPCVIWGKEKQAGGDSREWSGFHSARLASLALF